MNKPPRGKKGIIMKEIAKETLDISMSWSETMRAFCMVSMNCRAENQRELLDQATELGEQLDEVAEAHDKQKEQLAKLKQRLALSQIELEEARKELL